MSGTDGRHRRQPRHASPVSRAAGRGVPRRISWASVAVVGVGAVVAIAASPFFGSAHPTAGAATRGQTASAPGEVTIPLSTGQPLILAATSSPTSHPTALPSPTSSPIAAPSQLLADGIPQVAYAAFQQAAAREQQVNSACGLSWPLLAAIGRVESDDGRFDGAVLHTDGTSTPKVIGPALNGQNGMPLIRATDGGALTGDPVYSHAVGPMQFIPSTWAIYGVAIPPDTTPNPFNIYDAAATAAVYLCDAGGNLTTMAGQTAAVTSYNNSASYVSTVLSLEQLYAHQAGIVVPIAPGGSTPPRHPVPPANPGRPGSIAPPTPKPTATSSDTPGLPSPTHPSLPSTGTACPTQSSTAPSASASTTDSASGSATASATPTGSASQTASTTDTGTTPSPAILTPQGC